MPSNEQDGAFDVLTVGKKMKFFLTWTVKERIVIYIKMDTPGLRSSAKKILKYSNDIYSCRQLEENINKWTLDLEDMEKVFLNQATQVP